MGIVGVGVWMVVAGREGGQGDVRLMNVSIGEGAGIHVVNAIDGEEIGPQGRRHDGTEVFG